MWRWYDERRAVLLLVWICCAGSLPIFIERGWIPHDEGAFAHSAERVLQGELPHRDFDEIYTGGLSQLHALGFALFGVRLSSIRLVLLGFALAFVPALYGIAARLVPPLPAGFLTLVGVAWSLPNYFAGVPSWYNLFFATFGTLALLRHLEGGGRGWLVLAGVCGGLSILAKISGVYFVAAALLFLIHREQWLAHEAPGDTADRTWALWTLQVLGAGVFAIALGRAFWWSLGVMELVLFVLPGMALAAFLPWFEVRNGHGAFTARARVLLSLVLPFALGVVAPLVLFMIPYVLTGAMEDLVRGVFILPARRVQSAAMALPAPLTLVAALPYAGLLLASVPPRIERALALVLTLALVGVAATAGAHPAVYRAVWYSVRPLVPIGAIAACLILSRSAPATAPDAVARQRLFLLVAVASLVSLVQFPYAFGIYFCYAAPLVVLALAAVVGARPAPRLLHLCVLVFYLAFALLWLNPGYIRGIGLRYIPDGQTARLALERGGLLVYEDRKLEYERLITLVRQHAGDFIYAAPDAPEIYFLSARRNPTRTIYDIFDQPEGRTARILGLLDAHDVKVAVIHSKPEFSPPLDPELARGLTARFPFAQQVGRFEVRWRP
jgi:hypothetical protein